MKPVTALFIRACKSRFPLKRCQSVYNRFHIRNDNESIINNELCYILAKICDEQIGGLSHSDSLKMMEIYDKYHCVLNDVSEARVMVYIAKIRYHSVDEFKDSLPLPRKFRH